MDLSARADTALSRGQYRASLGYFRALARLVPNRSISYGEMCRAHEALGERARIAILP
jgi:hypothetical protein